MLAFDGIVWRMIFEGGDARLPATAPEGRFHHAGQTALYTSLTVQGTLVAMQRYLRSADPPRLVVPLTLCTDRLADLRGQGDASVVWQDIRATGLPAPTWAFSDKARRDGAQGMFYSSRSRPDLTHLVLFDLATITHAGEPQPVPGN